MPTLTMTLTVLSFLLLGYLLLFGIGFGTIALTFALSRKRPATPALPSGELPDVTVLIPAHHEGESIIDTVETLLRQDYRGTIAIQILIQNAGDSSYGPLVQHYGHTPDPQATVLPLLRKADRSVSLLLTGYAPKREKLNECLGGITAPFTAILDADHRAAPDWVSTSVARLLAAPSASAVQSRRGPLSLQRIYQLWDSIQNHVGNEVLNTVFSGWGRTVFFTGTTCVFRTEHLKRHPFPDCITEDTYLSYTLVSEGHRILYNSESGSFEEVAPDLKSYFSRRRRWSAGHTKTLVDHLLPILRSPLPFRDKAQLLTHGQFFLLGPAIALLLFTTALFVFLQLPLASRIAVLAVSLALASLLPLLLSRKNRNIIADLFVGTIWWFPQITSLAVLTHYFFSNELYYFLISFPYAKDLVLLHVALLVLPFTLLLAGARSYPFVRWYHFLFLIPTYPVFLFIDIYAVSLGFVDFLMKKTVWAPTTRSYTVEAGLVPETMRGSLGKSTSTHRRVLKFIIPALAVLGVVAANEFLMDPNCGDPRYVFWQPFLFEREAPVRLNVKVRQSPAGGDRFTSTIVIETSQKSPTAGQVRLTLDGKDVKKWELSQASHRFEHVVEQPFGWSSKPMEVLLYQKGLFCAHRRKPPQSMVQMNDNAVLVNGEPFLIKGVVPSFSSNRVSLPMKQGLSQIKALGANTVRFYHRPTYEIVGGVAAEHLLLIDQPEQSTWDNVQLTSKRDRKKLWNQFRKLMTLMRGFEFSLLHNMGNELEFGDRTEERSHAITDLLKRAAEQYNDERIGYSSYLTHWNYPANLLGINMLDTGQVYWKKAIENMRRFGKPVYASEFGGFVAYFELPPSDLRSYRMMKQWNRLLEVGLSGAVFFQSHDNWAQPLYDETNDPFAPDQPDDVRGLWTEKNEPKPEIQFLEHIYSDFEARLAGGRLELQNRRPYRLSGVKLYVGDRMVGAPGDFEPGARRMVSLPSGLGPEVRMTARYQTHHGLQSVSALRVYQPEDHGSPAALHPLFVTEKKSRDLLEGYHLGDDGKLDILIPSHWKAYTVNGEKRRNDGTSVLTLHPESPMQDIPNAHYSTDGANWKPFNSAEIGKGMHFMHFEVPPSRGKTSLLIISGLGNSEFQFIISKDQTEKVTCHSYRECLVDPNTYDVKPGNWVSVQIDRQWLTYTTAKDNPFGTEIQVELEHPRHFSPRHYSIRKVEE